MLLTVAETQGVTAAAKKLNLTPSAVSQAIRSLEKDNGVQLFVRVGKKLMPTEFTLEFCFRASQFFESVDELLKESKGSQVVGHVRIGAPPLFGAHVLVPKLKKLLLTHPKAKISISIMDTKRLMEELMSNKIDLAFCDTGLHLDEYRDLQYSPVYEEELIMCSSKAFYRQNCKGVKDMVTLVNLPHVPSRGGREAVHKWYQYHYGKSPKYNYQFSIDTAVGVLNAIYHGFGIGVVPLALLKQFEHRDEIMIIPGKKETTLKNQVLCCQHGSRVPSKLEKLIVGIFK